MSCLSYELGERIINYNDSLNVNRYLSDDGYLNTIVNTSPTTLASSTEEGSHCAPQNIQ